MKKIFCANFRDSVLFLPELVALVLNMLYPSSKSQNQAQNHRFKRLPDAKIFRYIENCVTSLGIQKKSCYSMYSYQHICFFKTKLFMV